MDRNDHRQPGIADHEQAEHADAERGAEQEAEGDNVPWPRTRQVVHRAIAEADLKLRAARALMHERYDALYDKVARGTMPDGADIADVRAICVHATDVAINVATMVYQFARYTGLHHPSVIGRLLRDLNTAGIHQVMSDTAYENHGQFKLGLSTANPLA